MYRQVIAANQILTVAKPHAVATIDMANRMPATRDEPKKFEYGVLPADGWEGYLVAKYLFVMS